MTKMSIVVKVCAGRKGTLEERGIRFFNFPRGRRLLLSHGKRENVLTEN